MTTLLDKIFIQSFGYFNSNSISNLTIEQALKVTDLLLLNLTVDYLDSEAYNSYFDNFIQLNNLLNNYFILTEDESGSFNNLKIEKVKSLSEVTKRIKALENFKKARTDIYKKYEPELITLVSQFKNQLKAA